jgi:hypothetical protein
LAGAPSAASFGEPKVPLPAPTSVPDASSLFKFGTPLSAAKTTALTGEEDSYASEVWAALLAARSANDAVPLNALLRKRHYEALSISIAYRAPKDLKGNVVDYCEHHARQRSYPVIQGGSRCEVSSLVQTGLDVTMRGWLTRQLSDELGTLHADLREFLPVELERILTDERQTNLYGLTGVGALFVYEDNAMRQELLLYRGRQFMAVNRLVVSGFDAPLMSVKPPEFGEGWVALTTYKPLDLQRIGPNILAFFRGFIAPEPETKKRQQRR